MNAAPARLPAAGALAHSRALLQCWTVDGVRALRRARLTIAFTTTIWVVGAATGSLLQGPDPQLLQAIGVGPHSLLEGRWWTPVTAAFWCPNLAGYLVTTVLLLTLSATAEHRIGAARTGLLLLVTQTLGAVLGSLVVQLGARAGEPWTGQLAGLLVVGASPAAVGTGLALTAWLTALWRRRLRLLLLLAALLLAAYRGTFMDVLRLIAALLGLAAGSILTSRTRRPVRRPTFPRSSNGERRVLVALAVAATAIGPITAALSATPIGPLAVLRDLLLTPPPEPAAVQQICADPSTVDDCRAVRAQFQLGGLGPAITSLLPIALLLVAADGLRRGRRAAWSAAVLVNLALAGVASLLIIELTESPVNHSATFGGATRPRAVLADLLPFTAPLLVVILLLLTRRSFHVPAPPGTYRRVGAVTGITLLALAGVFVGGGLLLRDQFDRPPTAATLLLALPARFVPPGYLNDIDPPFLPLTTPATVLYEWTGPVFLTVLTVTLLRSFRRNQPGNGTSSDPGRARQILLAHGGPSLAYMILWPGNSYHFAPDGQTVTAYRVVGTVAVGLIGPVGPPAARDDAIIDFTSFCADRGLTPCLYSIATDIRDAAADRMGWRSVQIAEETIIPLGDFTLSGKKWQSVRTARNKASQLGITAQWIRYPHAPRHLIEQIKDISEEWVADKGLPEMGFTLGGLSELDDEYVRCLIAVDATKTVHGIVSFLPAYEAGQPAGWTLDLMRRRSTGFPGVMEFLIATAALDLQGEAARFLSLSGAPLARTDDDSADPVQRLLDIVGTALEPVYGFRSLLAFKAKFRPIHQSLWLSYPDPAALAGIATAITRCYLPRLLTPRQGSRLLRRRFRPDPRNPAPARRAARPPVHGRPDWLRRPPHARPRAAATNGSNSGRGPDFPEIPAGGG